MTLTNKNSYIQNYKPEIDGIRAFAIIAVIINHFNKEILPNGYLGVDIFFVISGFIITSSIFGRSSKNFSSFIIGFYDRRIRRLVPALSIFVLISSIFICMFSQSPGQSLKTGLASLFGLSNIYLFQLETNYFASFTDLNVFTHTWSLGVEEQFYFIYPFLIWFTGYGLKTKNSVRNLFFSIILFGLPSLIGFIYFYPINESASYFLMPFRFWEMASGCLLFLGFQKKSPLLRCCKKFPPIFITSLILFIMLMPKINSGLYTVIIVILSLLLITSLKKDSSAYKYFTNPFVVYIGKLSYSLYLWHWGILSISRWTFGVYWWTIPIQVLIIFVTSIISYNFFEKPLRKARWSEFKWINILLSGGIITSLAGLIYLLGKPFKGYLYLGQNPVFSTPAYNYCHIPELEKNEKYSSAIPSKCGTLKNKNSPTIYGIGDSHIDQFGYAISSVASKKNYNYSILWQSTCPFPGTYTFYKESDCIKNQINLNQKLMLNISPGDIVIVGNYLTPLVNSAISSSSGFYDMNGEELSRINASDTYRRNFIKFSEKIIDRGAKVVLYIDSVIFPSLDLPGAICTEEWFRKPYNINKNCKNSLTAHINNFDKYFKWREDWEDKKNKYVLNAYLYAEDCEGDICSASNYNDSNHFTYQFAKKVLDRFLEDNSSIFSNP